MEARILQSSSCCFSSLDTVNRYRFSPASSSPKPLSISFTQTTRTRGRVSRVLSMSKKDDGTDDDDGTDSLNYKDSGVDIDAGAELVKRIAKMAPGIGGFCSLLLAAFRLLTLSIDTVSPLHHHHRNLSRSALLRR